MANEPVVTITGNLTADPELRFLPSGKAVANFTLVSTNRVKKGDEWVDGDPTFFRVSCWERMAENVVESLSKGSRATVTGRLASRAYETKEGEKRSSLEIQADDVAASLRYATAALTKATGASTASRPAAQQQAADPWATTPGGYDPNQPPF
jgi:single-strand DNA-binding protein